MVSVNHAANNRQNPPAKPPKLHWRHMDALRWCGDDHHANNEIAVTPGRAPRAIWRAHEYCRTLAQVKPLIEAGLLELVRTEIYPGASCDVYTTSKAGKAAVESYYAHSHAKNDAEWAATDARVQAEQKAKDRIALTAALEEQFGGNYYIPALEDAIHNSEAPFLDVPMPEVCPHGKDGLPVTIREYLLCLWFRILPDDLYKIICDFLVWGETIGYDDALAMLRDRLDDDEDDETGGDLHSPYGRIS